MKSLSQWEKEIPNTESFAGKLSLSEELTKLPIGVMISMDSANVHLASLVGTRCISVWGATHHFASFWDMDKNEGYYSGGGTHLPPLFCFFGNKECYRKDWACLNEIDIKKILLRL